MQDVAAKKTKSEISFTKEVKEEIAIINETNRDIIDALLSAFIKINGNLLLRNNNWVLSIKTENIKAAKLIIRLLKEYHQCEPNITISEKKKLRVNQDNKIIHAEISYGVKSLLETLQIYYPETGLKTLPSKEFLKNAEVQRAYLAGAFLAAGSVNSPSTSDYHLEIGVNDQDFADYIVKVMRKFYLTSKVIKRRNQAIVYLKRSDQIADFLKIVGAYKSLMKYEEIRIQRDQYNSMNRVYNCDIANEMRAIESGNRQHKLLSYLDQKIGLANLDEPLKVVAQLRYENPEASLNELAELYAQQTKQKISKSGINHKLRKLMEIAVKFGGESDD